MTTYLLLMWYKVTAVRETSKGSSVLLGTDAKLNVGPVELANLAGNISWQRSISGSIQLNEMPSRIVGYRIHRVIVKKGVLLPMAIRGETIDFKETHSQHLELSEVVGVNKNLSSARVYIA